MDADVMRWPWSKKTVPTPSVEALRAKEESTVNLEKLSRTAENLDLAKRRNHFGDAMLELFRGVIRDG
jgi:hypothetical protein